MRLLRLFSLVAAIFPAAAAADLSDMKVYSPIVEKGEAQLELIGNTALDDAAEHDGFQHHEFEFEYGVTDFWATSITASLVRPAGESLKYDILGWENTFQLTGEGRYWLDLGAHFELEVNDEGDEPHNAEVRLLFRRVQGKFEHILNLNFEQEIGKAAEEATELEYIWRTKAALSERTGIGFEAFGSLGELKDLPPPAQQEHRLGPAFFHDAVVGGIEVEISLVWLFGLNRGSARHVPHWQIEIGF